MLSPSNQIWCVSFLHEWGVQRQIFLAPSPGALGRGQKVKYHLISITKSISKIFIPNFVCVLTNERYKTYQTGFSFCRLGHAPALGLWGAGGAQGVNFYGDARTYIERYTSPNETFDYDYPHSNALLTFSLQKDSESVLCCAYTSNCCQLHKTTCQLHIFTCKPMKSDVT